MRFIILILLPVIAAGLFFGCNKDDKKEPATPNYSWVEEFDTVSNAVKNGWVILNNSRPLGVSSWQQGEFAVDTKFGGIAGFPAHSYSYSGNDYVACTY